MLVQASWRDFILPLGRVCCVRVGSVRGPESQPNSRPFHGYVFNPWVLNSPELAANVSLREAFQLRAPLEPVKGHGRDAALEAKLLQKCFVGSIKVCVVEGNG